MPKVILAYGKSSLDQLVQPFFTEHGIDPNDVKSYTLIRQASGPTMIHFEMFFPDAIDRAESDQGGQ